MNPNGAMIGILSGFSISAICIALPCVLSFAVFSGLRSKAYFVAGILAIISLISLCLVSALHHQFFPLWKIGPIVCVALSTFLVLLFSKIWHDELVDIHVPRIDTKSLITVALLAGLAILDCFIVYNAQTWGIDGRPPYFHSPLQLDPRRTADLVAVLARGENSLFLPSSYLVYQTFWHHGASTILALLPQMPSIYHQVAGIGLATAFLMYALLFWILKIIRPSMHWISWAVLLIFILSVVEGQIGAYSDALVVGGYKSFEWLSIHLRNSQYFSLKLLALTAPQHTMFVALFITYIGIRWYSKNPISKLGSIAWILCIAMVVTSPILAAIALPFYLLTETCLTRNPLHIAKESIFLWVGIGIVSLISYWLILGFPIWDLFFRGQASSISYLWHQGFPYFNSAVLGSSFIGTNGTLGIAFSVAVIPALILSFRERTLGQVRQPIAICCITLFSAFLFWNFVVIDIEIRRHFSITASALMILVVFYSLSSTALSFKVRKGLYCVVVLSAILGAAIHLYMIRGYSGKNSSSVSFNTPWGDYLDANQFIREYLPHSAIIAASGEGMVLPVANEVAISLAPKLAIFAHQKIDQRHLDFLAPETGLSNVMAAELTTEWRKKAMSIGYDTVIWGPIEEEVWGIVGRKVLLDGATFIASRGRVGIYALPREGARYQADSQEAQAGEKFLSFSICEQSSRSLIGQAGYHLEWFNGNYKVIDPSTMKLIMEGPILQSLWSSLNGENCTSTKRLPIVTSALSGQELTAWLKVHTSESIQKIVSSSTTQASTTDVSENTIHTKLEQYPWVEADLGKKVKVAGLRVISRAKRNGLLPMRNVMVSVTEMPFPPGFDPLGYYPQIHTYFLPGVIKNDSLIPLQSSGRYIRYTIPGMSEIIIDQIKIFQ